MAQSKDKRRSPRIPFEQLRTSMEVGGESYQAQIANLSQEGVRLVLDSSIQMEPEDEVMIGVGAISPNIKGRVRWISPSPKDPSRIEVGVEFESFVLTQPDDTEIQYMLDAWRELSQDYTHYDAFLQILIMLDFEITDGKIEDLSEAVYSITVWLDQRLGPLNVWQVLAEGDGTLRPTLIVERHTASEVSMEERSAHVAGVARDQLTGWLGGHPYLFGENMVIEYLGGNEGQTDLLQRLVLLLSRRVKFWSKLLMKNISLQLLSDEVERRGRQG